MPYEIVCDGRLVDLDNVQYLLSPQDLAAYDLIPQLIDLGVASLKIEGRLKTAEYVANITRHYREAIDAAWAGRPVAFTPRDVQEMQLSFSRGFSHGFLDGNNHKVLVRGDYAKKRGILLGAVEAVTSAGVRLTAAGAGQAGRWPGVRRRRRYRPPRARRPRLRSYPSLEAGTRPESGSGRSSSGSDATRSICERLEAGQQVWKTDDPELTRRLRRSFEGPPTRMVMLDLEVIAVAGEPLRINGTTRPGQRASVQSAEVLGIADSRAADLDLFQTQLGRLGGTIYQLARVEAKIEGGPMVPMSLLNQLRRELVTRLDLAASAVPARTIAPQPVLPALLEPILAERDQERRASHDQPAPVELSVLCRRTEQIEAALRLGVSTIYADYQDIKQYAEAVAAVRRVSQTAAIYLATPRIEKPGEANLFSFLARQGADGIVVRNAGGMRYCSEHGIPSVADFSLNAANPLTVELLKSRGAARVTASYDLNVDQLLQLIDMTPPSWLEVVIHQQIPMFHMEHCVFCAFLSPGTDATNCGRPCDVHDVKLRDRVGKEHPLKADVGCRNTLYNAVPQTAAEYLSRLQKHGARFLRIEFLDDSPAAVERTITLYREVIAGKREGKALWRELKASNQYGVTRGPLAVLT